MNNSTYSFIDPSELNNRVSSKYNSEKTLIQLFCGKRDFKVIDSIRDYFSTNFPNSVIIGTTTDGIIDGVNVYVETKNVVTFTKFNKTSLKATLTKYEKSNFNSFNLGKKIARELCSSDTKAIISFADGIKTNGEEYLNGINSDVKDVVISGGLAADNGDLELTYVFDKYEVISQGAVGVSLSSKHLNIATDYTFDWTPIGKEMLVTKALKNRVYEIDGISAVDIYAKYMGHELALQLPQVGIEFPLIFQKDGISVGRAVLHKHNDGSLTFAGNISEGALVRFGVGSIDSIRMNVDYNSRKLIGKMHYRPEAIFIYSCMARRRFMKEHISDELKAISRLGKVSGFFTYGEFYHTKESNQLLNETMTILSLSEEEEDLEMELLNETSEKEQVYVDAQHVIAHLANKVSHELEELNKNLEERIQESANYIYKQAYYDKLTGLPNRLSLIEKLDESMGKILLLINIDDFTTINDFYGHIFGDMILKKLATTLQDITKNEKAKVFKLQSDEYAIILEISHADELIENRIKKCIQFIEGTKFEINDHITHISVTISAAMINGKKTAFSNADMALKLAKKAGREYMIFNDDLELAQKYEANIKMANIIRDAIQKDNIFPYYQPIYDLKTEKIEKYEALVRLKTNDDETLSPFSFLEISEKIKLYPQITEIMIEKTFSCFSENRLNFSINLSFNDILNEKTREFLFRKIDEYNIALQLTIEILETQENDDEEAVTEFIERVYKSGAKIAIDDFGSGFANFQHMTTMHSDFMKIDGSLIKNIDVDKNAKLVVETIILFAHKLNKKVVAEFIHSKEVYKIVKELGIDYGQGYYLGKPSANIF